MTSPTAHVKAEAYALGFDLVGVTRLGPARTAPYFRSWIAGAFHGTMSYLERGAEKRDDTRLVFEGSRSAVVVGLNYGGREPPGPVARYARGRDYHEVLVDRLNQLLTRLQHWLPNVRGKPYVDTGPILERDLAQRAGLGWIGKNTNLINPHLGSFFFLGSLFIDADLEPDASFDPDHCGTCTRCLDACPTQAFTAARVLDARRCISYLTIEHRGDIPVELRPLMGELVFGCDICQDVCPWNTKFSRPLSDVELAALPATSGDVGEWTALTEEEFRARFRHTPLTRTKRRGLARNAAVALGNRNLPEDRARLERATTDADALVRDHARWALDHLDRHPSP